MKKINDVEYEVAAGEEVTIKVTPVGVGPFVAAAREGAEIEPQPGTARTNPTFVFKVTSSTIAKLEFSFPGAPATAKYDVVVSGSGGGDTGGITIVQPARIKDPNFTFIVV